MCSLPSACASSPGKTQESQGQSTSNQLNVGRESPSPSFPACLCHSDLNESWRTVLTPLLVASQSGPTNVALLKTRDTRTLLHSLSLLRRWVFALYTKTTSSEPLCPALFKLVSALHQHKYWLLLLTHRLVSPSSLKRNRHISYAAQRLFDAVAKLLPCVRGEECMRRCAPFLDRILKGVPEINHSSLGRLFEETSLIDSLPLIDSAKCNEARRCLRSIESSTWHEDTLKHAAVARIKTDWRRWVSANMESSSPSEERTVTFLNLWRTLVCIKSNIGIALSRDIIASSVQLVPEIYRQKKLLFWRKEIDVLQEVLCYGSTLALQNEVSPEVSNVAQALVKAALSSNFLMQPALAPKTVAGFLGHQALVSNRRSPVVSLQFVQGLSLLLLKSTALILREATSCSSASEESDSSSSSRGSSFCEEARLIESNVDNVLRATHSWIRELKSFHPNQSFGEGIVELFFDQDDYAIEAMLCLVDIYQGLDYFSLKGVWLDFEPVDVFHRYMEKCAWDNSVLIDYLVSNETCFLLYLLKLLKSIAKKPAALQKSEQVVNCFHKLETSLQKLIDSKLFPYNIDPIMTQLAKVNNVTTTQHN